MKEVFLKSQEIINIEDLNFTDYIILRKNTSHWDRLYDTSNGYCWSDSYGNMVGQYATIKEALPSMEVLKIIKV